MQANEEVFQQILTVLKPFVPDGVEITSETDLTADLALESLNVLEILLGLEDHFDISIPINILPDIRTVKDLVQQIQKLIADEC
jgi:acyl carrier protein